MKGEPYIKNLLFLKTSDFSLSTRLAICISVISVGISLAGLLTFRMLVF